MFLMCSSRQIYIKCIIDWIVGVFANFTDKIVLLFGVTVHEMDVTYYIDTGTISFNVFKAIENFDVDVKIGKSF